MNDTGNSEQQQGNWMAVIPAAILFDRTLNDRDKIIYAIISNLTHERGYCWASNKYLAEKLDCTIKTIQRSLKKLTDRHYLDIEIARNESGTSRIIRLDKNTYFPQAGGMTKMSGEGMTNLSGGDDKNVAQNNIEIIDNITDNSNKSGFDKKMTSKLLKFINDRYDRNFRKINAERLKTRLKTYSLDEILLAIENAHADQFHINTNFKYLTPEYFTRNDDIIDKWLNTIPQNDGQKGKQNFSDWAKSISTSLGWVDSH